VCWAAQHFPLSEGCVIRCGGVCGGFVEPQGVVAGVGRVLWEGNCGHDGIMPVWIVIVVLDYIIVPEAVEDKAMYLG
jgi:hypothetical protein